MEREIKNALTVISVALTVLVLSITLLSINFFSIDTNSTQFGPPGAKVLQKKPFSIFEQGQGSDGQGESCESQDATCDRLAHEAYTRCNENGKAAEKCNAAYQEYLGACREVYAVCLNSRKLTM